MSSRKLCIPCPKPKTLSDPYFDWNGHEKDIAEVIQSEPGDLGWDAYWMIFYQHLPAANYEEGCYYVPYLLDLYQKTSQFEDSKAEGFFWFLDHFREAFEEDNLMNPILDRIWEIFVHFTGTFSIHRCNDEELVKYQFNDLYREVVPYCRVVHEMLDCFTKWPAFDPLLVKLRAHFDRAEDIERSFWYCECAFHARTWLWVDSEPLERRQALFDFFHRLDRFAAHYGHSTLNLDSKIHEGFYQYNRRIAPT